MILSYPTILVSSSQFKPSQMARFIGPTCRPQMGPMLAPWTLLSGMSLMELQLSLSLLTHRSLNKIVDIKHVGDLRRHHAHYDVIEIGSSWFMSVIRHRKNIFTNIFSGKWIYDSCHSELCISLRKMTNASTICCDYPWVHVCKTEGVNITGSIYVVPGTEKCRVGTKLCRTLL